MNDPTPKRFAALVLAADRTSKDPITQHTGAACKAFAPVGGIPMVIRVLDTLADCDLITTIILCGPPEALLTHCPELKQRIASGEVSWLPNLDSPSRSAESALNHIPDDMPVLLTTADHALLTPAMVQSFLRDSLAAQCDATVGAVREQAIAATFPGARRTIIHLRDGGFRGCNLFTFNPQGRALVRFWRQAEDLRKRPWRLVAQVLGFRAVFSYLCGFLTLQRALASISEKSGINIQVIMLDDPCAGLDVDKIEDLVLAESILNRK
ncbi:nucleotidyltransferase family protein [Nitrosomonas sp. Nm166]|uniref:nucleotidyltransferase family protein n=1 Tax=Nitrosomonas sp. Nm166 TaxID=1881054 RepID=UPI0008E45021|nr:nucleotidyltransferase family protein [Nitrosomonas sp. Nm166]SFD89434.1 2-C-methyl-D-erythritol 4-phosphate cytidylyltransferase [Nitrosomonas sp. Nm166]